MDNIKVRVAPNGWTAYVSEKPDENGIHHGQWKHSEGQVSVRWTGTEWVEEHRIQALHLKAVKPNGGIDGYCVE